MLIPIAIQGTLKDSVTQWVPTFFNSAFGSKTTFSLALTMALPIVNVTGAYFAKALNKRLRNEVMTSAVFFGISTLFLLVLRLFGSQSIALALVSMAGVTNCMFAINVMLITMVPLWFHKSGRVSTIGGFLNALAYIGCGGLNLLAGKNTGQRCGMESSFYSVDCARGFGRRRIPALRPHVETLHKKRRVNKRLIKKQPVHSSEYTGCFFAPLFLSGL